MFKLEIQKAIDCDQKSSSIFSSFQIENLIEKLKLLNFERLLLKEMRMKQINKYYFLKGFNPGEQFFIFISTCAWLISKTGKKFEQPQEFDDPITIISRIMKILQNLDIPTDFQSNKLIQGSGAMSIYVIDCLTTQALKILKFSLKKIEIKNDEDALIDLMENDSEIILEKVEEIQNAILSDGSDDEKNSFFDVNIKFNDNNNRKYNEIKNYKVDLLSENWRYRLFPISVAFIIFPLFTSRLELERILPKLKIIVKSDQRDWRTHLEQFKILKTNINQSSRTTQSQLKKMLVDITFIMDKVQIREKHLNDDLRSMMQRYKTISTELTKTNAAIKECEINKLNKGQEFLKITNDLENIKIQMERRGNSMTDGSNLISIKKSIFRINEEIVEMDIKIALMENAYTNEIIRQSNQLSEFESMLLT